MKNFLKNSVAYKKSYIFLTENIDVYFDKKKKCNINLKLINNQIRPGGMGKQIIIDVSDIIF